MAIPDYQTLMLPVLRLASEGEIVTRNAVPRLADEFGLSEEERSRLLPSGKQTVITNRVHWAVTYLVKAGLLHRPRRGVFALTDRGRQALSEKRERIDVAFLARYPEFQEFRARRRYEPDTEAEPATGEATDTPEERMDAAFEEYRAALEDELLQRLHSIAPTAFERLILDLMTAMGYGARGKQRHLGGSGDRGVDAIITEDAFGLEQIYLQAKRYGRDNNVGASQVREFAGALDERGASKGVLITTGRFTTAARDAAERSTKRIILVDGEELARLMVRYRVGVRRLRRYDLERIDEDYFEQLAD